MAFTPLDSADLAVGKPVKKSIVDTIKDNFDDHESRISALSAGANKIPVFEYQIDPMSMGIGDIKHANMTLAQYQDVNGTGWVLCDGSSCAGSVYAAITGQTVVPDVVTAARFVRSATSDVVGASVGQVGSLEDDTTAPNGLATTSAGDHTHTYNKTQGVGGGGGLDPFDGSNPSGNTGSAGAHTHPLTGDAETRPTNISLNYFIKINLSAHNNVARFKAREAMTIVSVKGYIVDNHGLPTVGNFELDIQKGATIAALSTAYSTKPTLAYSGGIADGDPTSSGTVIAGGYNVASGDWLQLDITSVMSGQSGMYIQVFAEPA